MAYGLLGLISLSAVDLPVPRCFAVQGAKRAQAEARLRIRRSGDQKVGGSEGRGRDATQNSTAGLRPARS